MAHSEELGITMDGMMVGQTKLSEVDGETGRLTYRGYHLHDLVASTMWEEVVYLLWYGELPTFQQYVTLRNHLAAERELTEDELAIVRATPTTGHGMDALRTMISALALLHTPTTLSRERVLVEGIRLTAKLPTLLTAWARLRMGKPLISPDPSLSHAAHLLHTLHGTSPDEVAVRALDTYMVVLAENGLNISTFVASVIASTRNDLYSAITAAIATLKGLSHGGANEQAMRTFLEIGRPERAAEVVEQKIARKERMMGIGHRVFAVEDPRVRHMREQSAALAARPRHDRTSHDIAEQVAATVRQHPYFQARALHPNVEFYSAPLLYQLGIPLDCFTALFACARMAGWVAHVAEQLTNTQLVRPEAKYVGEAERPAKSITPLEQRTKP